MGKKSAADVLERLKQLLKASSDSELCRVIGINRQTLANWKGRDSVPYSLCVQMSEENNVSLDWLLTGVGTMYRNAEVQASGLNPRQTAILELFEALDGDSQREIQTAVEEKKRLIDLERRVAALEAAKKQA